MSYTKLFLYGDIKHYFNYERDLNINPKRSHDSAIFKYYKKLDSSKLIKKKPVVRRSKYRSQRSKLRTKRELYRLIYHNMYYANSSYFLTLTFLHDVSKKQSFTALTEFAKRLRQQSPPFSYVAVPEKTKKGRIHFHVLLFNFETKEADNERVSRNIQRQWTQGFCDIRSTYGTPRSITSYLVKYISKSLDDENGRAYATSKNLLRPVSGAIEDFETVGLENVINYDTPYLGKCSVWINKLDKKQE